MNNRREFFKVLGSIAAGVVGAKVASYIPKEEVKEELMVCNHITFLDKEGNKYNPLVTPQKSTPVVHTSFSSSLYIAEPSQPEVRKFNQV